MILNQIISVSATSLSLAELLEESLEKVLELMGFHVGIVYMLDADRRLARAQHQRGVPPSYISKGRTIKIHHWPFNFIFVAGQPRYIEHRPDLNSIEAGILRGSTSQRSPVSRSSQNLSSSGRSTPEVGRKSLFHVKNRRYLR